MFALGGGLYWLLHVFYWVFGLQFYEVLAPNDSENYRFCGSNLPTFTDWQTVPVFSSFYCWTQALFCIFVKIFKYFQVLFMFYINSVLILYYFQFQQQYCPKYNNDTSSGLGSGSTSRTSILYWTSEQEQHYDILIDTDSDSEFNYKGPGNLGINSSR